MVRKIEELLPAYEKHRTYLFSYFLGGKRLAWSVLAISMSIAIVFWYIGKIENSQAVRDRFKIESQEIQWAMESRLLNYRAALRTTTAFFESVEPVNREQWQRFSTLLDVDQLLPEVQRLGYVRRVRHDERSAFVDRVRATTYSRYNIFPPAGGGDAYPVLFVEPLTPENENVLGFDMYTSPLRRAAMIEARETGKGVATPGISLFEVTEKPDAGFSIFRPVFSMNQRLHPSGSDGDSLVGYTFASFRFNDLMHGILFARQSRELHFAIFEQGDRGICLYESDPAMLVPGYTAPPGLTDEFRLEVGGRIWLVRVSAGPLFANAGRFDTQTIFLLCAIVVNSFLFFTLIVLARVRSRAEAVAVKLSDELQLSNDRLKQLDSAKTEFLSNASHELRTPISIIREFVALVRDGVAGEINHDQEECLDSALRNCDRLGKLINGILDLQRMESGRVKLRRQRVDLRRLLTVSVSDFLVVAEKRGQSIRLNIEPDLPAILCDPERMTQILINLIGNAVKFTPENHTITISGSVDSANDQCVAISISNPGLGISPADLNRLFERFAQLDESPRAEQRGSGLGLAITKELVRLQQGHISVSSHPGGDTVFLITLPVYTLHSEIRAFISDAHLRAESLHHETVLLTVSDRTPDTGGGCLDLELVKACVQRTLRQGDGECLVIPGNRMVVAAVVVDAEQIDTLLDRMRTSLGEQFSFESQFELSGYILDEVEKVTALLLMTSEEAVVAVPAEFAN